MAVTVLRQGKTKELTVTVGEMKSTTAMNKQSSSEQGKLGLAVRPLTEKERKEARIVSGLYVEGVNNGPAERAGIQVGDVILSVNGELVANVEQLRSKVSSAGKRLAVLVLRDNNRLFIPINLD